MKLSRHKTQLGPRWAIDGYFLPDSFDLRFLLSQSQSEMRAYLDSIAPTEPATDTLMAPIEDTQEVWASGVTYGRSREARQAESDSGDVYDRVYIAQRPELFFKGNGWRIMGHQQSVRFRADSAWNVPEPELTLVINQNGEIVGYTAGNDMSSRSIEGENPLYLPQAKVYNASCSLGPAIHLFDVSNLSDLPIEITIERSERIVFHGDTSTADMARKLQDLVDYLFHELDFPHGVFLLTGTGIVPPDQFTLNHEDQVTIRVGSLTLINRIGA
jgi:2-dehydro-3-deoxy-D-arabinonate dehydratase